MSPAATAAVHRIEVFSKPGAPDPRAESVARDAAAIGLKPRRVRSPRVYLVRAPSDAPSLEPFRAALPTNPPAEQSI
ncbi:MAG: hypothetical protein IBJ10_12005, partial [Phycisphaerales bacterium]|nr:hypothetical protein [Phycisphaerales bacterium]